MRTEPKLVSRYPRLVALPRGAVAERFGEELLWPALPIAVLVALAIRLPYVLGSDFPLNDGGMFVAMSRDLLANHFALPAETTYDAAGIAYAYPPLAFYLVAALSALTGLDAIAIARFLPLLANVATVGMAALLARELLPSGWAAFIGATVFALVPRSYEWMIMGGGLTRAFGYLFAVACIVAATRAARRYSLNGLALCALLAALALASHLEEGLFALYTIVLIFVLSGQRIRSSLLACAAVGLGAIVASAPWWGVVVAEHGLAPFLAASRTSNWSTFSDQLGALGSFVSTPSVVLSLLGALALIGIILCLVRVDLFLPLWLLAIFVITPRSAQSEAALPLAFLASLGACEVVAPSVVRAFRQRHERLMPGLARVRLSAAGRWLGLGTLAVLLALVTIFWRQVPTDPYSLNTLPSGEREAMAWIASETPPDERFLVLASTWSWEEDMVGEWFPVLAQRASTITPQGAEWLPADDHAHRVCMFVKLRTMGLSGAGLSALDAWASERGVEYSAIYISKQPRGGSDWSPLIESAVDSPMYDVLLDTPAAAVLQRKLPVTPYWSASGPLPIARDCQSLGDQSLDVQTDFEVAYGPLAASGWVQEHDAALPRSLGMTDLIGRLASRASALRRGG
ncbi:MAG: glycosyltransferase family 39 protein [Chloroflexi bacterium]|nr:glycosyltransferase family 39 protein [Chloroflexota bacterium]